MPYNENILLADAGGAIAVVICLIIGLFYAIVQRVTQPPKKQKPVKYVPDPPKRVHQKKKTAIGKKLPIAKPKIEKKKKAAPIKQKKFFESDKSKKDELKAILDRFNISGSDYKNNQLRDIRMKYKELTGKLFATNNQTKKNRLQEKIDLLAKARILINKK
tara:strand:- start:276 stop:758 length:483 start_codon:yes stop_codon:yes gene_type:complete